MSRPLSERMKDWRYWMLDQGGHLLLGLGIAYAFEDMGGWGSWGFSTGLGILRELLQNLRFKGGIHWDGDPSDAGVDVVFWTLGAVIGSLIA